ncbi:PA-phosphatase [Reichenbachiella carrageenanivorans]|uniref:PA-phosphatase n=1 Tax=Reichenbachiella carrageenanivorans TaxID=2979869 RepID=A0ABY6D256_9BACT|nr:phosphatase PAP2 family protein [Reichenbachiella carrageenanivorans]UXX80226.1 PA-phosphatase [Reichenbachiella carrageenanivorans]
MREKTSSIISYLFHPLLMPSMTFLIIYWQLPELIKPLTLVTLPFLFITTFIIPILSVAMLKFSGSVTNFKLDKQEERVMPFSFVTVFYGLTTYLFVFKIQVNEVFALLLIATTLLVSVLTLITVWYKVSIHSAGISGVVGFFLAFGMRFPDSAVLYPLLVLLVVAGLVMSARLKLNAHTPKEVLVGMLIGLTICFGTLYGFA